MRGQALTWPEHWEDPRVQTQQRALQVPGASRDHGGAAWGLWTQPDEDQRAERDQGPRESKQGRRTPEPRDDPGGSRPCRKGPELPPGGPPRLREAGQLPEAGVAPDGGGGSGRPRQEAETRGTGGGWPSGLAAGPAPARCTALSRGLSGAQPVGHRGLGDTGQRSVSGSATTVATEPQTVLDKGIHELGTVLSRWEGSGPWGQEAHRSARKGTPLRGSETWPLPAQRISHGDVG